MDAIWQIDRQLNWLDLLLNLAISLCRWRMYTPYMKSGLEVQRSPRIDDGIQSSGVLHEALVSMSEAAGRSPRSFPVSLLSCKKLAAPDTEGISDELHRCLHRRLKIFRHGHEGYGRRKMNRMMLSRPQ